MQEDWDTLFAHLTSGIYILTTGSGEHAHGMSASWVSQVSADPLLLGLALGKQYRSCRWVEENGRFALNVVGKRSRFLQDHFHAAALRGHGYMQGVRWEPSPAGLPWLLDALVCMDCEVVERHPIGDRIWFVARATAWRRGVPDLPLSSADLPYVFVGRLISAPWREATKEHE